ncbi:hypothetical protein BDM02DRAFT_3154631 [Thelephora ganbajun]|uniref:Uncharacterized protein n=1 Tax=Thelephora ganbajun TaxID=370292 RepID=A0ACB6ZMP3_THEGA|nr:hypothetical protein BDM02DRAFT_3154631 [Thelephora ganbajun]
MSFPAILRAPQLADRFAHLRLASASDESTSDATRPVVKKNKREDREGKRWIRRKENSRFVGNPHVVAATRNDYQVLPPDAKSTFPEPLPAYLSRNAPLSTLTLTHKPDPNSSSAGRFSLSIKGMRRELRKAGARAQYLVKDVESEIVSWLHDGTVFLSPDEKDLNDLEFPGKPVGGSGAIHEVARTPLQLVWAISEGGFARYVVHCCARYHGVVSFSKDTSGQRLTYLLRPNVSRPSREAANLDTPPATDFGYSSRGDLEEDSDITLSDRELASSIGSLPPPPGLSPVPETQPTTRARPHQVDSDDDWSMIGDDLEADAELSESEGGKGRKEPIVGQIPEDPVSGSLTTEDDADTTPRPDRILYSEGVRSIRPAPLSRVWDRRPRNGSSPSRSPTRCSYGRTVIRHEPPQGRAVELFYAYLFGDR